MTVAWRRDGGWVRLAAWESRFGVTAVVSTRPLGDMKNAANFERRLREIGLDAAGWVGGQQVHGGRVVPVARPRSEEKKRTDGLITRSPGLTLRVFTADCVPVFLVDPVHRAIGLVHAGWRGVLKKIVLAAIERLARHYHTRPEDLRIAFGPHIGACCYEVGPEVAAFFQGTRGALSRVKRADNPRSLNLSAALCSQVVGAGVRRENILRAPGCTVCSKDFFSYRRDKTEQRQAAILCLPGARTSRPRSQTDKRSHENR